MKILYLIDTLSLGGAQRVLKGIMEHPPEGQQLYAYALRKTPLTVSIAHPRVMVCRSGSRWSLKPFREISRIIRQEGIEIVHCQLPRSQITAFLLKKMKFRKLRLIIHEQGDIFEPGRILPFFFRRMHRAGAEFIACSAAACRMISKKCNIPLESILCIHNYVDLNEFSREKILPLRESQRMMRGMGPNGVLAGFAGRLIGRKGWREVIRAAVLLRDRQNLSFLLAGAGGDEGDLLRMIRENQLEERVQFVGYCEDMPSFYAALDVLLVPSHWEPMGITEIEAMACGIPVIASDVEGLNEVVEDGVTALLFPAGDAEALAGCIRSMLDDAGMREKLVDNAFQRLPAFSFTGFRKKLDALYLHQKTISS